MKQTNRKPSHSVFLVEGEGETAYLTRIGAAWQHEDGDGFNVKLSAIPLAGRIVIRRAKSHGEARGQREAVS